MPHAARRPLGASLANLLAAALVACLLAAATPASAGTQDAPEVSDPAGDQAGGNQVTPYDSIDIVAAWVAGETVDSVDVAVATSADIERGPQETLTFTITLGDLTTTVTVAAETTADANTTPSVSGSVLTATLERNATGVVGDTLELSVASTGQLGPDGALVSASDEAGPGAYVLGSMAGPGVDSDADGADDADELAAGTDPNAADSDGDGLDDGDEADAGSDPLEADSDGDGLDDGREDEAGSNPNRADSDGDGIGDADEVADGSDPTKPDSDGDGLTDKQENDAGLDSTDSTDAALDADGDGVSNADEIAAGTDPNVSDKDDASFVERNLLWILIAVAVLLTIIIAIVIVTRRRRRNADEAHDGHNHPPGTPHDPKEIDPVVAAAAVTAPAATAITPEYLESGLTEEDKARARRLFEEREARYFTFRNPDGKPVPSTPAEADRLRKARDAAPETYRR